MKAQTRAAMVIKSALIPGAMERDALFAVTKAHGIGSKSTYNALTELGLKAQPSAFGGPWVYKLPGVAEPPPEAPAVATAPAPSVATAPASSMTPPPAEQPVESTAPRFDLRVQCISSAVMRQLVPVIGAHQMRHISGGTFQVLDLGEERCGEIEALCKSRQAATTRAPHRLTRLA
jgi:hypothetical protein